MLVASWQPTPLDPRLKAELDALKAGNRVGPKVQAPAGQYRLGVRIIFVTAMGLILMLTAAASATLMQSFTDKPRADAAAAAFKASPPCTAAAPTVGDRSCRRTSQAQISDRQLSGSRYFRHCGLTFADGSRSMRAIVALDACTAIPADSQVSYVRWGGVATDVRYIDREWVTEQNPQRVADEQPDPSTTSLVLGITILFALAIAAAGVMVDRRMNRPAAT